MQHIKTNITWYPTPYLFADALANDNCFQERSGLSVLFKRKTANPEIAVSIPRFSGLKNETLNRNPVFVWTMCWGGVQVHSITFYTISGTKYKFGFSWIFQHEKDCISIDDYNCYLTKILHGTCTSKDNDLVSFIGIFYFCTENEILK